MRVSNGNENGARGPVGYQPTIIILARVEPGYFYFQYLYLHFFNFCRAPDGCAAFDPDSSLLALTRALRARRARGHQSTRDGCSAAIAQRASAVALTRALRARRARPPEVPYLAASQPRAQRASRKHLVCG